MVRVRDEKLDRRRPSGRNNYIVIEEFRQIKHEQKEVTKQLINQLVAMINQLMNFG